MKSTSRTPKLCLAVLLAATLAVPAFAAPAAETARPWLTDLDTAQAQARKGDRMILVDLYAEWCGWCKQLEREVFTHRQFLDATKDFVQLRVDVQDGAEGSMLQSRFGATSLPTLLILDSHLALVGTVEGYYPVAPYVQRLRGEVAAHEKRVKTYEAVLASTDEERLADFAEEMHQRGDGLRAAALYERLLAVSKPSAVQAARLRYQRADAFFLAGDHEKARAALGPLREEAAKRGDAQLAEAVDFLAARIVYQEGDCEETRAALEAFLEHYPKSPYRRQVSQTLRSLEAPGMMCT